MLYKFCWLCVLAFIVYYGYLNLHVDLKKRYKCDYVVVTGATGGVGKTLIRKLLKQLNVIAVGRNANELAKLKEEMKQVATEDHKVVDFVFDFKDDLLTFAPKFDEFLKANQIEKKRIGVCYSNAGFGEYKPFHSNSYDDKEAFMKVNVDSHVVVSDYFIRLFLERKEKSGLEITSSALSYTPGKYFCLYHVAKASLSALGNALYAEYLKQGIDVLVVHPSAVSGTKFYQHKDIKFNGQKIPIIGAIEDSIISVSTDQVSQRMLTRMGKLNQVDVGWAAVACNLLFKLGRNIQVLAWQVLTFNDKLWTKDIKAKKE